MIKELGQKDILATQPGNKKPRNCGVCLKFF